MPDKIRKYMFDLNIFDEDHVEEVEPEIPPPPTFSEEELEAARQEGFARGKSEGLAESKASRDQYVAGIMNTIAQSLPKLFSAETAREKLYEKEALVLALEGFKTLFPLLDSRHGLDETQAVIASALEEVEGKSEIIIEVHPDALEGVEAHIASIRGRLGGATVTIREGEDSLGRGDCLIFWKDGGAVRDATALAAKIKSIMEERLAGSLGKVHNERGDSAEAEAENVGVSSANSAAPPPERGE